MNFNDIVGQEGIKTHLKNALRTGHISHAYMIQGEKESGKAMIADLFAQALVCEDDRTDELKPIPCGTCRSCHQAMNRNHPDIIYVQHEKPNVISVDEIRTQVAGDVDIKPYQSDRKIYIIADAEKMNVQAQNALLKTLEEPPSYVTILLLCSNTEAMLPTIMSRVVLLGIKPVSDELVKKYLRKNVEMSDFRVNLCVSFARGNIGKAKMLAEDEEFDRIRDSAVTLLRNISDMEVYKMAAEIKKIEEYNMPVEDYLDMMAVWYRDVLLFKATYDVNHLIFADEIQYIKKVAVGVSYEGLEIILLAIDKAKQRLRSNVNYELTMQLLFMTIRDYQH